MTGCIIVLPQPIASILQEKETTFAKALEKNSTLMGLDLVDCKIRNKGTAHLATAIQTNGDEGDPSMVPRGAPSYGKRYGPPYFTPWRWLRYAPHVEGSEQYKSWCVGFHRTMGQNVAWILLRGLRKPSELGVKVAHGQAGSNTRRPSLLLL